jgi:hypothetical protein
MPIRYRERIYEIAATHSHSPHPRQSVPPRPNVQPEFLYQFERESLQVLSRLSTQHQTAIQIP